MLLRSSEAALWQWMPVRWKPAAVDTMRYIILPQAFKAVLPTPANEFIVLLKETSVASYVSVADLTYAGSIPGCRIFCQRCCDQTNRSCCVCNSSFFFIH